MNFVEKICCNSWVNMRKELLSERNDIATASLLLTIKVKNTFSVADQSIFDLQFDIADESGALDYIRDNIQFL